MAVVVVAVVVVVVLVEALNTFHKRKNSCEPIKKLDSFGNVYEVCPICGRNSKEENLYCPDCGTKFKRILMTLEIPL